MGYYEYRFLPDADREHMFQDWCRRKSLDPETEGVADDFIASLDSRFAEGETISKAEMILIVRSINPDITALESKSKADVLTIYNQVIKEASADEDTHTV